MAVIYANDSGRILRILTSAPEEQHFGAPPGSTQQVRFDTAANLAVLQALAKDYNAHFVVAGVLQRNGVPVLIAPPGLAAIDQALLGPLLVKLFNADPLMQADIKLLFRIVLRGLHEAID